MHTIIHMQICVKKGRGRTTGENRESYFVGNTNWGNEWQIQFHTWWRWIHISKPLFLHVLLFVPGLPGLGPVLPVCCGWDGVNRGALLAGGL